MRRKTRTAHRRPYVTDCECVVTSRGIKRFKARLRRANQGGWAWRELADFYPGIKFGTLQRFATTDYIPLELEIRLQLHLSPWPQPVLDVLGILHGGMGCNEVKDG